ncbi:MAG TPA: polyprenol monophosphomannose synthase [Nitriliruptorales bacterium]
MKALVVIPTFNEQLTIERAVELSLRTPGVEVLVVDDNSPDGTGTIAQRLAESDERIHVMHRERKLGLGPAYRAGLGWGIRHGYDVLVEMDADLSHDPQQLPGLIAATEDADLVVGSRYVPGGAVENWPWHRRVLSAGGNRYVQLVTGVPVRDATSGFRAYRRAVLEVLDPETMRSDGYSFQLELVLRTWRAGFAITEVPITFVERREGASKISRAIVLEALWRVLLWGLRGPRRGGARHPRSIRSTP